MKFLPLFLLVACGGDKTIGGSDPGHDIDNPGDGTTETETVAATIASERTYAEFDGNTVSTWIESTSDVAVTITGSEPTYTVDTVFDGEIAQGSTATIDHQDGNVHFVSDSTLLSGEIVLRDCVDISGEWVLTYEGYDTEYPFTVETASCNPQVTEIRDDNIAIDGFHYDSEDWEGVISDNGESIALVVKNDRSIHSTATRK